MRSARAGCSAALALTFLFALSSCAVPSAVYTADPPAQPVRSPSASPVVLPSLEPSPAPASPPAAAPLPALRAVGLGDSVMSGTNCGCDGIMAEYARRLAKADDRRVTAQNFGVGGYTTQDLLDDLGDNAAQRSAVARADIVVVIIGANDLNDDLDQWRSAGCSASCYGPDVAAMGQRLARLLAKLTTLSHGDAEVLVTNYWNVFTDGKVALQSGSAELRFHLAVTRAANEEIATVASASGARLVDLVGPFKGAGDADPTSLLAADGDHPNAAGVKAIAAALVAAT